MKVVILGHGILGRELRSKTQWDVISRKADNFDAEESDLDDFLLHTNEEGVLSAKHDVVVNCIANTNSYSDDHAQHMAINFFFVQRLVDFCNQHSIKLVHISTEFVYAENPFPPKETDLPLPNNSHYAKSKLLADYYLSLFSKEYLVCRLLHKKNDFNPENVWDCQTSGDLVSNIAPLVIHLIKTNQIGVYNVGTGDKSLTDLSPHSNVIDPPEHVPKDTRMNLEKLQKALEQS
ncbi:MAG: sugar nucleotide-binding protein [Crocinitomicaceae bacterium]|nr:sugar nucleotide-binding protein [Crocinitomicaceae bacterium]